MTRRTALRLGALGGAAITGGLRLDPVRATERARADAVPRFALPLKIPPDLIPTARKSDRDEYTIVQREAAQEILPGRVTKIWGYEGMFPGPTIRVRRNRLTVVR